MSWQTELTWLLHRILKRRWTARLWWQLYRSKRYEVWACRL